MALAQDLDATRRAALLVGSVIAVLVLVSLILAVGPFYGHGIDAYYTGQHPGAPGVPGDPKEFAPFSWFGGYVPTAVGLLTFGYGPFLSLLLGGMVLAFLLTSWSQMRRAERGMLIGIMLAAALLFAVTLPMRSAILTWLAD